ncbi:inorganic pyrophosphatase [Choanephora cucurbitarum]|nr:inorganic pyrophosphatase [Choanephora cucurbitarum]
MNRSLWKIPFVRYYGTVSVGKPFTAAHRVYVEKEGQIISPFHDIPLYVNKEDKQVVNMVVEIPRWTNAKVEISTDEPFNPLKQDVKKGKPRFVRNCFPHKGYIWNYGALPQGDNDPIDVIEIGQEIGKPGQIKQVKVLGVMAMLDEGETDWKVVAIDTKDPLASKIHDVEDIDHHFPGLLDATRHFFRVYKVPDGKPENEFAYNGECKNQTFANTIIAETHEAWQRLIEGKVPKTTDTYHLEVHNLTVETSPYRTDRHLTVKEESFDNIKEQEVKEYDPKWYFVA